MRGVPIRVAGTLIAAGLALTACSPGSGDGGDAGDGTIHVVASTDVYGSILEAVGGERITVDSIVNRPSQDPHSYEATARDKLAVSKASLVVLNGGGYDSFMENLVHSEDIPSQDVLNAVQISGLEEDAGHGPEEDSGDGGGHDHAGHQHGEFNEHVWYDPAAMGRLADAEIGRAHV